MLLVVLLIPLMMVGFGLVFMKNPPKINPFYGYKTKRSMMNQDTWAFAHRYFGKLWFVCGLVSLPISLVPISLVVGKSEQVVSITGLTVLVLQAVVMVGMMIPTERALKKNFDEFGRPR